LEIWLLGPLGVGVLGGVKVSTLVGMIPLFSTGRKCFMLTVA
jgi:hypothetical protein